MSLKKESPSDVQLHLAALRGNADQLKRILDSGKVHVDCQDEDGTTPLILAAAGGHLGCLRELIDQGADVHARRRTGTSALFFASQSGHIEAVRLLLAAGAAVNAPSADGGTALFVACQGGHGHIVAELLRRGANVTSAMKDRASPLFVAAQNGHRAILSTLLKAGAQVNGARNDGATPLWIAAQMGHDHVVRTLLQHGAQVDAVRCDGATPLFKAAHKGFSAVVQELLKFKPNLSILPNGETAIHAAAMFGHLPVVKQLIAAGSDCTQRNRDGLTPLQAARQQNYNSVVEYLAERIRDAGRMPPTHCSLGSSMALGACGGGRSGRR